jgi:hypothetical protein
LIVIALALGTVLLLFPFGGKGALGGLGILGLLGLGGLFYRKKHGEVVADERDQLIQQRSGIIAYSVFWLAFVAAGVFAPLYYGYDGAVPAMVVANAVWAGFMLLTATQSIATLVQYGKGPYVKPE